MDFIIKDRKRNDLLKRDEITAIVKSEANPSIETAKKSVADSLHSDIELVVIRRIKGRFGSKEFNVEALIYENKEAMQQTEPKPKAKKEEQKQEAAEGKVSETKKKVSDEVKPEKKEAKPEKPEQKEEAKEIKKPEQKKEEKTEQKSSK